MAQRPSLIPQIIEMGIAPAEMLQEVQARQVIYGGSEELNLVELGVVDEEALSSALAQASSLPASGVGPLPVDRALTARLIAAECDAVAGWGEPGHVVAFVQRTEASHIEDVVRICGESTTVVRASALRVEEARALCASRSLDPRIARVLDAWGSRLELPVQAAATEDQETDVASLPQVEAPEPARRPEEHSAPEFSTPDELRPLPSVVARAPAENAKRMRPMSNKAMPLEGGPPSSVGQTAPPPVGYEDVTARSGAKSARQPDVAVHYDLEQARADLLGARTRDQVIEIAVTLAAAHFDYAAAFGLQKTEARGLTSLGAGTSAERVRQLTVPLDLPSALSRVQRSGKPEVLRLRASGMEGGVARDLARAPGLEVYLHPVGLRGRTLLLIWCDQGTDEPSERGRRALQELTPDLVEALTRVLIERKRASRMAQPNDLAPGAEESRTDPTLAPPTFTEPPPPLEAKAQDSSPKKRPVDPELDVTRKRTNPRRPAVGPEEASPVGTERNPAAPPAALATGPSRPPAAPESDDKGPLEVAPAKKRTLTRPQAGHENPTSEPPQSFPPEGPRTLKGFPKVQSPVPTEVAEAPAPRPDIPKSSSTSSAGQQRAPLMSRRIVPVGKPLGAAGKARTPSAPVSAGDEENEQPGEGERAGKHTGLEHIEAERYLEDTGAPHFEAPQSTSYASHVSGSQRLPPEAPLPNFGEVRPNSHDTLLSRRAPVTEPVEEDWDNPRAVSRRPVLPSPDEAEASSARSRSWSELVSALIAGDESTMAQLIEGGETAVGALIAEFPGPVTPPETPSQAASACGPVLKALAHIGTKATPFITVRTADEDADVRRWATLLLGELPGRESARAIASRLLDTSVEVRRAALASARRVRNDSITRRMLRAQIESMSRDANLAVEERSAAIEALADIREHEAVPSLLMLLESSEASLRRPARWALCVLTRQDFGDDVSSWQAFWQEHRDEDRVEWLINSLDHENRDIRRAAGEELRSLSGQDFGFDEDQGQAGRRRAQASFRSWWTEIGKASLS